MNRRHAFSLIEAAVVLGVIGLVVGGIWVAAASVRYEMKMRQTVDGIMVIRDNVARFVAGVPGPFTMSSNTVGLADVLMVGAPGFWIRANRIVIPFNNGTSTIQPIATFAYNKGPPDLTLPSGLVVSSYISVSIIRANMTQNDCVRLTREIAARSRNFIEANMRGTYIPDPQAIVAADCPSTGSAMMFYFTE